MTERQQAILNAIVEQYAEVASPVGSTLLAKLFNVSSATIRAEMAELERRGYITQPHTSAGRIPTDKGYRLYVNNLNELSDNKLPAGRVEKALSARVQQAGAPERMIRNAVDTLVELTHNMGLATIGNQLYMSGLSTCSVSRSLSAVSRLSKSPDCWIILSPGYARPLRTSRSVSISAKKIRSAAVPVPA